MDTKNPRTVAKLFPLIPQAIKAAAETRPRDWSNSVVNFDRDTQDFFHSPFFYSDWSDDNQITVAIGGNGQTLPA